MSHLILHERAATWETNQLRLFWVLWLWCLPSQRRPWRRSDPYWQQKNNLSYNYMTCIFGICYKNILRNVVQLFCIVPSFNDFPLYTPLSRFLIFFFRFREWDSQKRAILHISFVFLFELCNWRLKNKNCWRHGLALLMKIQTVSIQQRNKEITIIADTRFSKNQAPSSLRRRNLKTQFYFSG